jgi:hypothetical protein
MAIVEDGKLAPVRVKTFNQLKILFSCRSFKLKAVEIFTSAN